MTKLFINLALFLALIPGVAHASFLKGQISEEEGSSKKELMEQTSALEIVETISVIAKKTAEECKLTEEDQKEYGLFVVIFSGVVLRLCKPELLTSAWGAILEEGSPALISAVILFLSRVDKATDKGREQ